MVINREEGNQIICFYLQNSKVLAQDNESPLDNCCHRHNKCQYTLSILVYQEYEFQSMEIKNKKNHQTPLKNLTHISIMFVFLSLGYVITKPLKYVGFHFLYGKGNSHF